MNAPKAPTAERSEEVGELIPTLLLRSSPVHRPCVHRVQKHTSPPASVMVYKPELVASRCGARAREVEDMVSFVWLAVAR